ncbi:hypothetical protein NECAME_00540 [Necator americanus]|uniref:Uncharacterized protein n=1 Tax=Necator americanus TaxID=51031 RepID=W2T5W5_NECAM|nr:hypothetical protein NECAME_00540 [Necator americanus]ETN77014.1 hypothetical protein NECAME_00540 [Necator americanus]
MGDTSVGVVPHFGCTHSDCRTARAAQADVLDRGAHTSPHPKMLRCLSSQQTDNTERASKPEKFIGAHQEVRANPS